MFLIEPDKRGESFAMNTVYSEEKFYIPDNLYIIGLMNTADRSIALIDYALRRRFSFIDIEPAFGENFVKYTDKFKHTNLNKVLDIIMQINNDIESDESLGKGFRIGHSYFCNLKNADNDELLEIIDCDIIPLLEEYWIENNEKVKNYSKSLHEALINE
jgi:5-methylcytosine-specific restriction protein B